MLLPCLLSTLRCMYVPWQLLFLSLFPYILHMCMSFLQLLYMLLLLLLLRHPMYDLLLRLPLSLFPCILHMCMLFLQLLYMLLLLLLFQHPMYDPWLRFLFRLSSHHILYNGVTCFRLLYMLLPCLLSTLCCMYVLWQRLSLSLFPCILHMCMLFLQLLYMLLLLLLLRHPIYVLCM